MPLARIFVVACVLSVVDAFTLPLHQSPRPLVRYARSASEVNAEAVRLKVVLAKSTEGASFNFDCQKQLWLYRRCAATYTLVGDSVEIVAEGDKAKLEAFVKWIERATSGEPQGMSAESGDGGGLTSVDWTLSLIHI